VDIHDSEQEQIEALKRWWKSNGTVILIGLAIGLGGVGAWNWWRSHVETRAAAASKLYAEMETAVTAQASQVANQRGNQLLEKFSDSGYAPLAALVLAKAAFQQGDAAEARRYLQWVLQHADRPALRLTARLRLARLDLAAKDYDGALTLLESADPDGFTAEFEEARGDVMVAQGKSAEARSAYQRALGKMLPGGPGRARVQLKLDDLGHINYRVAGAGSGK